MLWFRILRHLDFKLKADTARNMPNASEYLRQDKLPDSIELYRDENWRRTPELAIETAAEAEALIERTGFCAALTDARRNGPSIYIAVAGRRDAHMPRNVQKDPEASLAWNIKDEVMRRGRVYYGKLARGRAMFLAPRLIPYFGSLRFQNPKLYLSVSEKLFVQISAQALQHVRPR